MRPDRAPDDAGTVERDASEAAAVAVFVALTDPIRRSVLDSLARRGPSTVSDLANRLPITRQAVAKHLAHLVEAGLLRADEPDGRRVRYRVDPAPVQAALRWLNALATDWDDRLDALRHHVEQHVAPPAQPRPDQPTERVEKR
jgi:DNA-binding transcriptional ArsR family regulator